MPRRRRAYWFHCWRCASNCHAETWGACIMCGSREVTVLPEPRPVPLGQTEMFPFGSVDEDLLNPDDTEGHRRAMVAYVARLRIEVTPTEKDRAVLERIAAKNRFKRLHLEK